jgi:mannose-6-phosphate isomerase-like protein (cupin superfamily)
VQVIDNATIPVATLPGIEHRTLAGSAAGLSHLSVWKQAVAPGAATPPHFHDCEEVVLIERGSGEVRAACGTTLQVKAGETVLIPTGEYHQIANTGRDPLAIVGIFASTPVGTFAPEGTRMELPWKS